MSDEELSLLKEFCETENIRQKELEHYVNGFKMSYFNVKDLQGAVSNLLKEIYECRCFNCLNSLTCSNCGAEVGCIVGFDKKDLKN